jgi:hypothetical protein
VVKDNKSMTKIVVDCYKSLFGAEHRVDINLVDDFWDANGLVKEKHKL